MDNPKLFDSTGHFIDWFGIAYVRGHKKEDKKQYEHIEEIFGATGAALMIRADLFKKIGGFDKDFFMLFEEDDLCWRTWLSGFQVLYAPRAIVHHKSGEIRVREGNFRNLYLSRKNRITSMLKNYSLKNLIRFLPIHISLMFTISILTKDKSEYLKALFYAELNVAINLKSIIQKRYATQFLRKISDEQLLNAGIIRKPCITDMLKNGY